MYTCGPTVYAKAHIGNLRAYIFADTVKRVLEYGGYKVKHIINITDVGHLTSDADEGEDKMQKAAREQKSNSLDISKKYTNQFIEDIRAINIILPYKFTKATEHIQDQIDLIKILEKKGFTYKTKDGIYFDTSKFPEYGDFAKLDIAGLKAGDRIEMGDKKNKTDFALWKFSPKNEKRDMEWDSPWGVGFPGWHIECSAMSMKYLGKTFDIHTGGIDHIPIHHTNEIAQSQCATGKKFVNYWLHSNFLVRSDAEKMGKSFGNVLDLNSLRDNNFNPLSYKYLCLNSHYRKRLLFGEKIMVSASNAFNKLKKVILDIKEQGAKVIPLNKLGNSAKDYLAKFKEAVFNDLNTPQGIAIMWNILKDKNISGNEKITLLNDFDGVLGLGIPEMKIESKNIPPDVEEMFDRRNQLRKEKKWAEADKLRVMLEDSGYLIKDSSEGSKLEKR